MSTRSARWGSAFDDCSDALRIGDVQKQSSTGLLTKFNPAAIQALLDQLLVYDGPEDSKTYIAWTHLRS